MNEPPQFPSGEYKASVLSIAPYKTPVVHVKVNTPSLRQVPFVGKMSFKEALRVIKQQCVIDQDKGCFYMRQGAAVKHDASSGI